ncbi:MAG: DUF4249 domain-containing protein [Bacteroidales bacterium]
MLRTKVVIIFWVFFIFIPSCIIPYEPVIAIRDINKYVVSGQVTDNNEIQTVSVSRASPISDPAHIEVTGCYISIFDDKGNQFEMQEAEPGIYHTRIDKSYLTPGTSFKVDIMTPDGINIESDFDKMSECPEIDTIYFIRKEIPPDLSGRTVQGLQFYIDLDAGNLTSHFFRWEAIETWEYHVPFAKQWYYDGAVHHISPPDSSGMVCWSTETVKNIYTLSTEGLTENRYSMLPLHFVDNYSPRLMYGYSLLINQIALSEAAYSFWDQLRINNSEQGGLYEKQPLSIAGNLHNNTNPDQEVLGFFGASSVKSRRIFISHIDDIEIHQINYCKQDTLLYGGLRAIFPSEYPAFLVGNETTYSLIRLSQCCVECMALGGKNIKPDFWPK